MIETLDLQTVLQHLGSYLTIRVGEADLGAVATSILVLALAAALLSGLHLWRIGKSEDRQTLLSRRLSTASDGEQPEWRVPRWYERLGAIVATTPVVGAAEQQKLLDALAAGGIK